MKFGNLDLKAHICRRRLNILAFGWSDFCRSPWAAKVGLQNTNCIGVCCRTEQLLPFTCRTLPAVLLPEAICSNVSVQVLWELVPDAVCVACVLPSCAFEQLTQWLAAMRLRQHASRSVHSDRIAGEDLCCQSILVWVILSPTMHAG